MPRTPVTDKSFLNTISQWLEHEREILVHIRFAYAAGLRSFEFFNSTNELFERLRNLRARTSMTVFRKRQLPIRGIVDDAFIQSCMQAIPENTEFLVAETVRREDCHLSQFWHTGGETHTELREALEDSAGKLVAVGLWPQEPANSPDVLTAYVPDEDGVVRLGAY